jgi:hypothetical protein
LEGKETKKKLTPICYTVRFMSLNDLHLSASLISTLYPSTLISPNDEDSVTVAKKSGIEQKITANSTASWKSLGNNQKNILIVVDYPDIVHLPDDELNFLTGMLTACRLSLVDVAIINTNNYKLINYKDILAEFNSKIIFLFGVSPGDFGLPVNFPFFQLQTVSNCTFLYTPALEQRHTDKLLKSRLWVSLRSIFSI